MPRALFICIAIASLVAFAHRPAFGQFFGGTLYSEFGGPVVGGEVIVGVFTPDFDPRSGGTLYNCYYGYRDTCNLSHGAFEMAVSDGNFIPLGAGATTDSTGAFSGFIFPTQSVPVGTEIWMFAFEDLSRSSLVQVLASSSNPSWRVGSGLPIDAGDASIFVLGSSAPGGVRLSVVPFPEPSSILLSAVAGIAFLGRRGDRV